jgi:hypothetical protein
MQLAEAPSAFGAPNAASPPANAALTAELRPTFAHPQSHVGFPPAGWRGSAWSRWSSAETVDDMFTASRLLAPRALLLSVVAVAAVPCVASAAERYASPTGGGVGCTSAAPCSLASAVGIAGEGDEVIAGSGDYQLTTTVDDKAKITIRGVPGEPRPRFLFGGQSQHGLRLMHGSLLRDVEIQQAEAVGAVDTSSGRLDRVVVRGGGGLNECSVTLLNATIRDSLVVADTSPICSVTDGVSGTGTYHNVTAVAAKSGAAIIVIATSGSATIDLTNVIAQGATGGAGFTVATDVFGGPATVTATHSNFASWDGCCANVQVVDGGGNQHDPPKFVNAAAGDYRQAPGSRTIDAGIDQPLNGAFDVDGDARRIDTTDIGADEFVRPVAVATGSATGIGPHSATLTGSVAEIGVPTSYRFEYGLTTAYNSETPATDLGAEVTELPVTATVDALSPDTTYHFRIVATNKAGVGHGQDQTFTTAPAPATPPSSSSISGSTPSFAGVVLVSRRLTLSRGFITLALRCPAATVGGCSGQTKLSARRRTGTRNVTLGKARFTMAADGSAKVRVRVSRAGLQRLTGVRRLRARAANATHDGAGASKTTVASVTIHRRRQAT